MKKIVSKIFTVVAIAFVFSASMPISNQAFADGACAGKDYFFGIPTWHRGLTEDFGGNCEVKKIGKDGIPIEKFVWSVIGNLMDGVFRIVGVASVAFIILGGFKYMLAGGNANKLAGAKITVTNAVVGLIISLIATAIIGLIFSIWGV